MGSKDTDPPAQEQEQDSEQEPDELSEEEKAHNRALLNHAMRNRWNGFFL